MSFRDRLKAILQINATPHHIAISFAFGVFWGMSPLLGLHTIGAFFTAWLLRLNRFVAVIGVYITNPWTIIPIYSFSLWVGAKLMGTEQIIPEIAWNQIKFTELFEKLAHLLVPFIVGSFAVGIVAAVLSYFIIYGLVVKYRDIRHHAE